MPNDSKLNKTLNLFEEIRTDERSKSRESLLTMPGKEEVDDSQREYLRGRASKLRLSERKSKETSRKERKEHRVF